MASNLLFTFIVITWVALLACIFHFTLGYDSEASPLSGEQLLKLQMEYYLEKNR